MMSVRETPWAGLGVTLDSPPTIEEAIGAAGLDWEVKLKPLFAHPAKDDAFVWESPQQVASRATVRASDGMILGVVGHHYTVVQNREAFGFFQPFLDAKVVELEAAGTLYSGRRVWVLAKITQDPTEVAPGDGIERYILLSNSHDGTLAVRVGFTALRLLCSNQLHFAHSTSRLLRVRHSRNVHDALEMVQQAMDVANREFATTVEQMKAMVRKGVVDVDIAKYVREVFKPKVFVTHGEEEKYDEEGAKRLVAKIIPLFEEENERTPQASGTVWTLYNGVTNYLSHERGRNQDSRVDSLWYGDSAQKARRALTVAARMAVG